MKIRLEGGLAFVEVTLTHKGRSLSLQNVILDTGSAATLFSADEVAKVGVVPEPQDPIRRVLGVGGSEFVFSKQIEKLVLGEMELAAFPIQVGAMDYGFPLQGLLGMDFFLQSKAVIDLGTLEIRLR